MYIHLGNNYIISLKKTISILNIIPPISNDLKEIIEIAQLEKRLINISEKGKEKTLVLCDNKVYLSPISSNTLYKRAINIKRGSLDFEQYPKCL
jgi:regulator of extracellular matrix RemA (YlzA/DUF370 family)